MTKQELEAFAKEAAKSLKSPTIKYFNRTT